MEKKIFQDAASLAEYMVDNVEHRHYIVATLFFDEAQELLRELLLYDNISIGTIEIEDKLFDDYCGEYYISLTEEYILSVEKAFKYDQYLITEAELMLIDSDASSRIIRINSSSDFIEIEIDYAKFDEVEQCSFDDDEFTYDEFEDELFDNAELIYDGEGNAIGIRMDADLLFHFLFS